MDRETAIDARLARLERLEGRLEERLERASTTSSSRSSRQALTFGSAAASGRNQCDAVCKAVGDKPARQCLNMTGKPAMHEGQAIFLCGTHMKVSAQKLVTVHMAGPCTGTYSKDQGFVPRHDPRSYESPRASAPPTSPPPVRRRGLPINVHTFADLGSSPSSYEVVHHHSAPQAAHQDDSDLDGVAETVERLERHATAAEGLQRLERQAIAAEARRVDPVIMSGPGGCYGRTQSGALCKNRAGAGNMYCHLHGDQARRGAAVPSARTGCGAGGCHSTVQDKDSGRERYCRNPVGDHPTHCARHR